MKLSHSLLMTISIPTLGVGWVFAVAGVYFLTAALGGFDTGEENASLAATWAFLFSLGAVSISGLIAARAQFAEKAYVNRPGIPGGSIL
jgi:hypothetical protein